ncbi:MAG TPA: NADP-dependent oxidoreductase [Chloroflexia bacterium]|nr:NADP-dependent oxidoreductase [Chloroflexia bacterium]
MSGKNMQVLLASRPQGEVLESNFKIVETDISDPVEGQVLVKNQYLSLDPYMRGRMDAAESYAAPVELGDPMVGGTVGVVVESHNPKFQVGDMVLGFFGWQQYGLSDGKGLRKVDTSLIPASVYLGSAGMPGITAWHGLMKIGEPKEGETVVVSAASGAVGSVVGQLAKQRGCRAVGIAGGQEKCDYVVNELGFDACVDYKAGQLKDDLKKAAPDGIDIYFDNVGGDILETCVRQMNTFGRIPLCGLISQYNATEPPVFKGLRYFLTYRLKLQGFIVGDSPESFPQALTELVPLIASGKIKYRESIVEGLENAPRALIGLLKGENFGKQLVKLY